MIFPSNFEQKIGFDLVRQMLKGNCLSPPGLMHVEKIGFSAEAGKIRQALEETEELRQLTLSGQPFPSQDYYDLTPEIHHIRVEGAFLEPEQLSRLKLSLATILQIVTFLNARSGSVPRLMHLAEKVTFDKNIPRNIEKIIDERSKVRDSASTALGKIRKEKISKQSLVERKIQQNLKTARKSGWTPEDADITLRDGRLVIPLLSTHKRKILGVIHDESSTGQTVYLEPADVLETNNELRELDYAERREIIRILTVFSDELRPQAEDLLDAYYFLGAIDFIRAKALFALSIRGILPSSLSPDPIIHWNQAIHPLLFLSHERQKKTVVPLSLELNENQRILIISGPNAGGKSVCLKTVGLLQYMLQCGLLIPVREDSVAGIFQKIYIDIGDEQSLENDLSTYTSKLYNIKFFIEHVDDRSLFLIDEFGTGTDPALGGSIAEASLEAMNEKKALGVVTTHYSNLKLLAGRLPGIVNGAMLYDSAGMKPLYQLKTGNPGSSFAFEIAQQIGFPEKVLEAARAKTGTSQLDFDKELQDLEVEKYALKKKSEKVQFADDFLAELILKYQKKNEDLEKTRKEILLNAKAEALKMVTESNKTVEKTIKEIRESQAEKQKTKEARKELHQLKEKLEKEEIPPSPSEPLPETAPAKSDKARVFHSLSSIRDIEGEKPVLPPLRKNSPYQSIYNDLQEKLRDFKLTLDLRGKRADESQSLLQHYIDDALLLTIPEVRILHGKGNGVLRQITRDYLSTVREVKHYADEALERGGSGITLVSFR